MCIRCQGLFSARHRNAWRGNGFSSYIAFHFSHVDWAPFLLVTHFSSLFLLFLLFFLLSLSHLLISFKPLYTSFSSSFWYPLALWLSFLHEPEMRGIDLKYVSVATVHPRIGFDSCFNSFWRPLLNYCYNIMCSPLHRCPPPYQILYESEIKWNPE